MNHEQEKEYLEAVLGKYSAHDFRVKKAAAKIKPLIIKWAGERLDNIIEMGSFIQGTPIRKSDSDIDLDLMVSLHYHTKEHLKDLFFNLYDFLKKNGLKPKFRNISMRVHIDGVAVDLVPAIKDPFSDYHTVYSYKKDKTSVSNPSMHIGIVRHSGMQKEIKLLKIWSYINKFDVESFYLTLVAIEALKLAIPGELSDNFRTMMNYISNNLLYTKFVDPANHQDDISGHHEDSVKKKVAEGALKTLHKCIDEAVY